MVASSSSFRCGLMGHSHSSLSCDVARRRPRRGAPRPWSGCPRSTWRRSRARRTDELRGDDQRPLLTVQELRELVRDLGVRSRAFSRSFELLVGTRKSESGLNWTAGGCSLLRVDLRVPGELRGGVPLLALGLLVELAKAVLHDCRSSTHSWNRRRSGSARARRRGSRSERGWTPWSLSLVGRYGSVRPEQDQNMTSTSASDNIPRGSV